ncbi:hypothetical protein GYH30_048208 [Glycine max]|uniref:Uncharacterized protein n=1 Tax=Glycine max TaxID=3847 RepID=A0A0R0FQA4_SOYBN|nr:hypothetical protein GYH30_048208 [Glycine max]
MYVDGRVRFRVVTCDEEDHRLWRTWRGEKREGKREPSDQRSTVNNFRSVAEDVYKQRAFRSITESKDEEETPSFYTYHSIKSWLKISQSMCSKLNPIIKSLKPSYPSQFSSPISCLHLGRRCSHRAIPMVFIFIFLFPSRKPWTLQRTFVIFIITKI